MKNEKTKTWLILWTQSDRPNSRCRSQIFMSLSRTPSALVLSRDGGGTRRGSGTGGGGDGSNGNAAPRDGVHGKGAANVGNNGNGTADEGNMEFNIHAIDLSDMKVCNLGQELLHRLIVHASIYLAVREDVRFSQLLYRLKTHAVDFSHSKVPGLAKCLH